MKFKRLISMFLSLAMIISCLTAIPTIAQAEVNGFTNLVDDPGFDGTYADGYDKSEWVMSGSAEGKITIETDTKDPTNKVLRIDCSENTKNISYVNFKDESTGIAKGTYYMYCKVRLAQKDATTDAKHYFLANSMSGLTTNYNATRPAITKDGWAECYGKFTVNSDNSSVGFKIIYTQGTQSHNVGKAVYEIDDFVIYDLASASNIAVPTGVEFTSDNVVKSHDSTYYAINGNDVAFTYGGEGLEALYINGEEATDAEGVYSYTVAEDVLVLAVANQANEDTVKYAYTAGTPYAIFTEDATVTLIVAGHNDNGVLTELRVSEVTGKAGDKLDLSTVENFKAVTGWANKTVFTWDGVATLNPIRGKCVLKDL